MSGQSSPYFCLNDYGSQNLSPANVNYFDAQLQFSNYFPISNDDFMNQDEKLSKGMFSTTGSPFENSLSEDYQYSQPKSSQPSKSSLAPAHLFIQGGAGASRKKVQIIQTSITTRQRWSQCGKGDRFQTKNIIKQLYTTTSNFLKMLVSVNQLTRQELLTVQAFLEKKQNANLACFRQLFSDQSMRRRCLQYFQSREFAANILNSRADLKSKLVFVKYLEIVRKITITSAAVRWKD